MVNYGWYSNKSRGMRKKLAAIAFNQAPAESSHKETASQLCSQAWAMLIKRAYEVDPLCCPVCGGQMQVVSFIEPPQADVIEAILRHCGLWQSRSKLLPPEVHDLVLELDADCCDNSSDPPWTSSTSSKRFGRTQRCWRLRRVKRPVTSNRSIGQISTAMLVSMGRPMAIPTTPSQTRCFWKRWSTASNGPQADN